MRLGLAALLVALLPAVAHADGMIVVHRPPGPRPTPTEYGFPLGVKNHNVTVTIKGPIAETVVDQTFTNPSAQELEGTYVFPLPEDAAVDRFSMWIDGKESEAELLDAQKARQIYEGIVRSMRDPALVEYMGRGMFRARIFPIPANGEKRIKISYAQVLKTDGGMARYRYPLATEKHSASPLEKASISVSIEEDRAIKAVYAPWQDLDLRRDGDKKLKASWEASKVRIERDFLLAFALDDSDVSMSALTYGRAVDDDGGTFLLLIAPKVELKPDEVMPKDVVFVLDTSGSMVDQGKIEQARRALKYCVQRLDVQDRFGLIDFSTDVRTFKDTLSQATDENKSAALDYIKGLKARGGTALEDALLAALKMRAPDPKRTFQVVFLTDGEPTIGTTDPEAIVKNVAKAADGKEARIFVFGVGGDVNAPLLDRIAETNRGDREYVLPGEDIEIAMSAFYDKVAAPVLSDLELTFEDGKVRLTDTYPNVRKLPDLFRGTQISVAGRFVGEGAVKAKLTGTVNGKKREFTAQLDFKKDGTNGFLPRIWAQRKIGFLLDQIRTHGETQETKDEVVRLARAFGIPTPYTSWLVVDENELRRRNGQTLGRGGAADQGFQRLVRETQQETNKPAGAPAPPSAAKADEYKSGGSIRKKEATGEDAAKDGKRITTLEKADKDSDDVRSKAAGLSTEAIRRVIQQVGSRTFYSVDGVWVDSALDDAARKGARKVAYLSDDYFKLLEAHPEASSFFALGSKVALKVGSEVVEVTE
ncbi:MAG TPA: VIT domain-containing protein [Planctomycetota bacterium]|nr:VIT domain-containing protein [Planctomycetota bacterium]